jgi:hypothetical protein
MEKIIKRFTNHIDNGGVTISIIDKGAEQGIVFRIESSYFGYPGIMSEIRIDSHLSDNWLQKVGLMLIEAQTEINKIDFKERYESL